MTIQRGKDLLSQTNPNLNEVQISIVALKQENKYVESCIEIGFREQSSGQKVVDEISEIIRQLEEKLSCLIN
jgi:hypothetical protein